MADEKTAPEAEVDIDSLDDKAFEDLKGKMRADVPEEALQKAETNRAPDGKFAKGEPGKTDANLDDDDPADGKTAETVPHGQFHRERERRKAAEASAEKVRADYAKLMDRTAQLLQRDAAPVQERQEQAPVIPQWDQDPIEAGRWTQQQLIELNKRLTERDQQAQRQTTEQQQWQNLIATANRDFVEAEKADPDARPAYDYLKQSYTAELLALGYTPQQAEQQLAMLEAQNIAAAYQRGVPINEWVKALAKPRGWLSKPATVDPGKSEAEKIAEREQTRLASQTLGKSGGAVVNTGVITPEQLLEMSDDDFAAYKKKHGSVAHAFSQAS